MNMREVVIVEAVRSPIGRRNGKLKDVHPVVLGSLVLKEIVKRAGITPDQVEDVVFGCVSQAGEQSLNIARGVESMTRVPMGSNAMSPGSPFPPELMELYDLVPQGISAELIARKYGISRRQMDEFGVRSHKLAHEATEHGYFISKIMPVEVSLNGNGH